MKKQLLFVVTLVCMLSAEGQNLLNSSTWTVGNGSAPGFSRNGNDSENVREYGTGPFGSSELLWKAVPDNASNADGGWNTSYHTIDNQETYRLTVWIKKTNSNSGTTYFGTTSYAGAHQILRLNNTVNSNPYFWTGDLPQLNKWYLLVGFVHGSTYNSTVSYSGVYDPVTGQKVRNGTDYKFSENATNIRHRAYLYYDTNTSDRQYFFGPRIEKVDGNEPPIQALLGLEEVDNNILDDSTWVAGTSGSATGFGQNGSTAENSREMGKNHVGDDVVLWKASPDNASGPDGGWNTSYHGASHTRTYRLSVWLKKTNSTSGTTYFGFRSYNGSHHSLTLGGSLTNNPYFFASDLPKLNRWYLLVGYVHKSSHTGTTNTGRMYDGVTGKVVRTLTDFKFKNTATNILHRSYLYYDTNTSDRQYFYAPRIDEVNGSEPTISELLMINENSKLVLNYDLAGNQTLRFYCEEEGFCSPPAPGEAAPDEGVDLDDDLAESPPNPVDDAEEAAIINDFKIYPNPTDGLVSISLSGANYNLTGSVVVYNINGALVKKIRVGKPTGQMDIDLRNEAAGVYFVHMHFTNGTTITEKIIKK